MAIFRELPDFRIIPHIPMARLCTLGEIAGLAAYQVSEDAAFLTAANDAFNGGQHM